MLSIMLASYPDPKELGEMRTVGTGARLDGVKIEAEGREWGEVWGGAASPFLTR